MQRTVDFVYQSYFDNTLQQNAILTQPQNTLIVPSTLTQEQARGYAVGLHPSSDTPIAIDFKIAGGPVYYVKPGEIVRPRGTHKSRSSHFEGFNWGLPFGWLGGGLAHLVIFQSPDAEAFWPGNPEIIFHRARFPIVQPAKLTNVVGAGNLNNAPFNWPRRFPWVNAVRGVAASPGTTYPQKGKPILSIAYADKVLLVVRGLGAAGLAAQASIRAIVQLSTDFDMSSAGTFTPGGQDPVFEDIPWPAYAPVGTSGNLTPQDPIQIWTGMLPRINADSGGVVFVDVSGSGAFNGCYLDVVRYGQL